jgi:4-alpha-glucanotransferase
LVPCLMGEADALGGWAYGGALPMVEVERNAWRVSVDLPVGGRVEYKYGLYDLAAGRAVRVENGAGNRLLGERGDADFVRVSDECFRRGLDLMFRGAGVAIPVFSLRSERGCGVGEFADLKEMAVWAAGVGLKMIQILPVNDTTSSRTWTDSYPYSAISVHALHPLYLRLDEMSYGVLDKEGLKKEREVLNGKKQVDYEAVMAVKWRVTREVFDVNHALILRDCDFLNFLKRNRGWVVDYAVFAVRRDELGTADSSKWGEWADYSREKAEALSINTDVMYYIWLQYELDRQLMDAVGRMHELGVALKGDLPIGVDRESVDAWVSPHLFRMDTQTGAPPDAFAVKGQNWGFPTYDWDEMRRDGYGWWRSRFAQLSRYFDAYRIDHILGFFRIWQIPGGQVDGILGRFEPALPVRVEEFAERGVAFDFERFCRPVVFEWDLKELFGDHADEVRRDFLEMRGDGIYGLKEVFLTQRAMLDSVEDRGEDWPREQLLDLVAEVLFFEVEGSGGRLFHPRIGLMDTRSFRGLGADVQWRLRELHDDYFHRRQDAFWESKAYEKLPAMRAASDMLLCGEDLGMVPACVPGVMARLGMLSLEIQRWPKKAGREFTNLREVPYQSVVATGTHDMATLRGWWSEDEKVRARFAWETMRDGFPEEELSGDEARKIIEQHMGSPAMWAVFPLQDLLAMDEGLRSDDIEGERINVPAITPFYWRWRMEICIEKLAGAEEFGAKLREMVSGSGR